MVCRVARELSPSGSPVSLACVAEERCPRHHPSVETRGIGPNPLNAVAGGRDPPFTMGIRDRVSGTVNTACHISSMGYALNEK